MKNNLIYEKFTQESDPVYDLGIGVIELWKKQREKIWKTGFGDLHKKYFSKYTGFDHELIDAFCDIIDELTKNTPPQIAFDNACKKNNFNMSSTSYRRIILAKVVNKEFHVKVSPKKKINEKFIQDSDPVHDLGIGTITFENIKPGDFCICTKPDLKFSFNDSVEFPKDGVYVVYRKKIHSDEKIQLGFLPFGFLFSLYKKDLNQVRNYCKKQNIPIHWPVHTNTAKLEEWEKHFRIIQRNELKQYGVYESLLEKFAQDSDPIDDMNIGIKNKIMSDLKNLGVEEKDITIENDGTIKYKGYSKPYEKRFIQIQLKYMPKEKGEFVKEIIDILQNLKLIKSREELLEESIAKALKNNISKEDIKDLIREFAGDVLNASGRIITEKLSRSKKQIAHDKTHNTYIFIGFNDKVPVEIKGKRYYEDKLGTESIIKIDKFNFRDLNMVSMAKLRARVQYSDQNGQVYMIELPKEVLDGERYESIPDHLYDIFDKYKRRV